MIFDLPGAGAPRHPHGARKALATFALVALALAACTPGPGPGGNQGGSGPGTPNVVSGRVTTEDGRPIAGARVRITGYVGGSQLGQDLVTLETGSDGAYAFEVEPGLYSVRAETTVAFDGQTYLFDLDPVDRTCDQAMSNGGIVEDWVLHLQGMWACAGQPNPDNHAEYHGAAVQLFNRTEAARPADTVVRFLFEPLTPLADGRPGAPITMDRTIQAFQTSYGPIDDTWVLYDIPLARYRVTAAAITSGGSAEPLLLSTEAAPTPAEAVEIAFAARKVVETPVVGYAIPSLTIHDR